MSRFNLSQWAITHRALVLFMILVLGAAGAYSYLNLGRAEDPSFTIKNMIVNVAWPGATATEMQTQVADKIEKKLQELPWLDRVETYSQPGVSFIQVILIDRTPPAKVKDLWYQVRKKVGDIRGDLPAGITGPNCNACSGFPTSTRSTSSATSRKRSSSNSATPSWRRSASRHNRFLIASLSRTPCRRAAQSTPRLTASICG